MTRNYGPDSLEDIAMETFVDYIELNFLEVLNEYTYDEMLPSKIFLYQNKCEILKRFIENSLLPPMLANELTRKLFKKIDAKLWRAGYLKRLTWYTEAVLNLLVALIHPTLSKLELGPMRKHSFQDYTFIFKSIIPLIYPEVHLLRRLKVLQLEYFYPSKTPDVCKGFPPNLEELTVSGFFTDQDLKLAVEICKCLKYLNVSSSEYVTDASVENILRIDKLISLDVVRTSISNLGVTKLLEGLTEKEKRNLPEEKLKYLGISYPTTSNLTFLGERFTEIRELRLHTDNNVNLIPLRYLEKLDSLYLERPTQPISLCKELLPIHAERLMLLDLRGCTLDHILQIGNYCKILKCLHLTNTWSPHNVSVDYSLSNYVENKEYPGFSTVECLQMKLDFQSNTTEFILQNCVNVRRLNIALHEPDKYYMLVDKSLGHLEEITWSPSSCISKEFAENLITSSKKLRSVKGLHINNSSCNFRGVKFTE